MKLNTIPAHIAVIMDGNGRWAESQGKKRTEGHREGANAIDRLLDVALEYKIPAVSLYAFSTENWKRPITEIQAIFGLLVEFIETRLDTIHKKGIRIHHSGARNKLSKTVLAKIDHAMAVTKKNKKLTANFCLNYGGHEEILSNFSRVMAARKSKKDSLDKPITTKEFEKYLYTFPLPPVDLLIRTAGEQRISNFLLWQSAYAEMYFTNTLWPDFGRTSLEEALLFFDSRKRKFGGLL
ncbi:isoprenyl transferase [Leptospira sp. 2 VSF19]|uniref:Isoprenyl transferase n=1 Tax=Leptospira soteropolitanensis TaxID=2950025 RepID=A0AAW5VMY6_9LEPT|nr:isoprenyl transferase [Leptospira soteropolitanensis]MCW7493393.1 isoprenyl transferase [Leptospira soteropolitanensis]MCW7501075.1 isoprenyl transferase [Leptospira soteropolitanensis]MCW7523245.1 isoprenyl transferase [Leptospira soteropolitanensis]MCW7527106.1 isoprenyl transferase [Leptospira soteropolitanensis]MCW7530963.1 isoprenyl transferase [Leptospira soteropolitanensis]